MIRRAEFQKTSPPGSRCRQMIALRVYWVLVAFVGGAAMGAPWGTVLRTGLLPAAASPPGLPLA
jgi:hypothetical protein